MASSSQSKQEMWVSIFLLPPPWRPGEEDGVQSLLLCGGTKSAPPDCRLGPMAGPSPPSGRLWPPPLLILLVRPSFLPVFCPSRLLPASGALPALASLHPIYWVLYPRPARRLTHSQNPAAAAPRRRHLHRSLCPTAPRRQLGSHRSHTPAAFSAPSCAAAARSGRALAWY
jgi:hypothetical protein